MNAPLLVLLAVTGFVAAAPCSFAEDAKTYTIKVKRDPKVGGKSHEHLKMTSEQSQKLTLGGKKLKEESEDLKGELTGIIEVLELSPHKKATKIKFTVEQFSFQKDVDTEQNPLKAGTVIIGTLEADGKEAYSADDKKVEGPAEKVLKSLLDLNPDKENESSDDIVFGTNQPRAVGSEWDVNKAAMLKSLPGDMPFKLTEKDISGKVRFPSVKVIDGKDHCLVRAEVKIIPRELKGMPPSFKASKAVMTVSMEKLAPVDEKLSTPEEKQTFEMALNGTIDSPDGKVLMETFTREERQRESKPVK